MKFSVGQFPVHVKTTGEIAIVIDAGEPLLVPADTAVIGTPPPQRLKVRVPTMGQNGISHNILHVNEYELYTHEEFLESELSQARERMQMNKKYAEIARQEDAPADTPATIPTVN